MSRLLRSKAAKRSPCIFFLKDLRLFYSRESQEFVVADVEMPKVPLHILFFMAVLLGGTTASLLLKFGQDFKWASSLKHFSTWQTLQRFFNKSGTLWEALNTVEHIKSFELRTIYVAEDLFFDVILIDLLYHCTQDILKESHSSQ